MDIDRPAGGAGDGPAKPRDSKYPNVIDEAAKCLRFIQEFEDENGNRKYLDLLQRVANREEKVVTIELDDVLAHNRDESFVQAIVQNTRRYQGLFAKAIDTAMPAPAVDIRDPDVLDVLREQRMQNAGQEDFPVELMRRFEVHIKAPSSEKPLPLRDVKAKYVGHLVTVKGIVTRMSEVRPLMRVATYVCDVCGYEIYQEVDSKEYMPLFECSSPVCKQNAQSKSGKLFPQIRGSRFVKFQDLKLQELPSEVPVGSIPRSLNVVVRGELTRRCVPGDIVTVTGIFLVTRQTGFRAINAGLTADTYLEVTHMEQHKKTHADLHISEEMLAEVEQRAQDVDIYTKLSKSIAPEIFGLDDVKRALLLLLVGGQTRVMSDGMKIRGDINILLLGDPGVAKSQLLKHISSIAPRGAYTTGKGSSGVGLTAAVIRDPITGEMTLEGGALVLADMGICCIDEFDKMEDSDRTAIHEVMEQQTVSIAKAGITTTLNARTSVLAAANPVMGRYNPNRSPEENIGLPTALLSRFDLTFILRDTPDEESDKALAQHVTVVHKTGKHPALSFEPFAPQFLRAYVNRARQYEPTINKELTDFIVGTYVEMRAESESVKDETRQRFCTARSLLSILRLSQALARLRFSNEVDQHDVQEAVRLLFVTKQQDQDTKQRRKTDGSVTSEIYDIFVGLARLSKDHSVKYNVLRSRAEKEGFSREDVEQMLTKYAELNVLHRSREGQTIRPVEK